MRCFFLICETGSTVSLNNMEYAVRKSCRHLFSGFELFEFEKAKYNFGENSGVNFEVLDEFL